MTIVAWVKKVYGDMNADLESLGSLKGMGNGRYIVHGKNDTIAEIEVVAPNVDEKEFAPYNVCPIGTVKVDMACIKPRKIVDYAGGCPKGMVYGQRTDKINIVGSHGRRPIAGFDHKEDGGLGIDVMEQQELKEEAKIEVESTEVCIPREPQPMDPKNIRMITDSIIGWGGFSEFPWWDVDWSAMNSIADVRYDRHAELLDEKGFAVCGQEGNDDFCLVFKNKQDAENIKKSLKYYDSSEFFDETKKFMIEDEGMKDVTDEQVYQQMELDKQSFWEDIEGMYPSYLGSMSSYQRSGSKFSLEDSSVFVVGRYKEGKWKQFVVCVDEKDIL